MLIKKSQITFMFYFVVSCWHLISILSPVVRAKHIFAAKMIHVVCTSVTVGKYIPSHTLTDIRGISSKRLLLSNYTMICPAKKIILFSTFKTLSQEWLTKIKHNMLKGHYDFWPDLIHFRFYSIWTVIIRTV